MSTTDETTARSLAQAGRHVALCRRHLGPLVHAGTPGASEAWEELAQASVSLTRAGVAVDAGLPKITPEGETATTGFDLETLRKVEQSRTEGEALLAALTALLPLAEALDKRRGNWVGDAARTDLGETPGTNYAERVQEMQLGLLLELHGAKGGGRE